MENYDYEQMSKEGYSCQCEAAGYCPLLDEEMSPHLHSLCQTNEAYRNRFLENAKKRGVHDSEVRRTHSKERIEITELSNSADLAIEDLKKEGIDLDKENASAGLGDTIEKVLSKFGITQEKIERIAKMKGCGCSKRKQWFNKIFSYNKENSDE
tara:strand:- start:1071 stop:1532 length:462 start_codon:yes stop_codon:yes gene_type:complete